jgi:thiol-disulfide isomerase/thioredoxin
MEDTNNYSDNRAPMRGESYHYNKMMTPQQQQQARPLEQQQRPRDTKEQHVQQEQRIHETNPCDDNSNHSNNDSDDEWLDELESDPALEALREQRLEQMRRDQLQMLEHKAKGHGEYRTISQDEFLPECTSSSEWIVVHFFHDEFETCKVMDHHLKIVAEQHVECKFLRIDARKAPFFCTKLKVKTLPTVLVLREGNVVNRLLGFEGIAEGNEWPTSMLQKWLSQAGAIQYTPPSRELEDEMKRLGISTRGGTIRRGGVRHYDDDDE